MTTSGKTAASILLIAVLSSALLAIAIRPTWSINEMDPPLSVPPNALNIGTVWEDEHFRWTVPVRNSTSTPIDLETISTSCNCLSVEPQTFRIQPGEQRELRMEIDLTSSSREVAVSIFPRYKGLHYDDNHRKNALQWTVKGQSRPILKVSGSVYVGRNSVLSNPLPVWSVPIETLVPLERLRAKCYPADFTATVVMLPADGKAILQITPVVPLRIGALKGTVTLTPVLKGGQSLPERQIRFEGTVIGDVEAEPSVILVGGRRIGEAFEDIVVVQSMTGRPFQVQRWEAHGEGLTVESGTVSNQWRVKQKVCRAGSQVNQLELFARSGSAEIVLKVPVRYTGLE